MKTLFALRGCKLFCVIFFALWSATAAFGEAPALVRDASVTTVNTPQGSVPAHLSNVTPAHDVTIILLTDNLNAADLVRLRREITVALSASFWANHHLQLVAVSGSSGNFSTTLTSSAQLQAALAQITLGNASGDPLTLIETLGMMTDNLPTNWANAIIVGNLPAFDKDDTWVAAWLGEIYRKHHVRLSFWSLDHAAPTWAQNLAAGGMGIVATSGFNSLLPILNDTTIYFEVSWETKLSAGAWPYVAELKNPSGERVASVTSLTLKAGYNPPIRAYLSARTQLAAASTTDEAAPQKVLALNPADLDALHRRAEQLAGKGDSKELSAIWRTVSEITPLDSAAWTHLAMSDYASGTFDDAETALNRATVLGVKTPATLELQARLQMRHNDFAGALSSIEEAVVTVQNQQSLWLLRAECARQLKQKSKEADSVERAASLGDVPETWARDLIISYLDSGQAEKAVTYLHKSSPPPDPGGLSEYAGFWERAHQPKEAENLWRKAISADPKREASYVGLISNYSSAERFADAGKIADRGLELFPHSLPLLLAKEQALEHAGDLYGARRMLARSDVNSLDFLKRRAALEDSYGGSASDAYLALLIEMSKQNSPQVEVVEACRRGLAVSLREERLDAAKTFADKLAAAGDRSGIKLLTVRSLATPEKIELPGGVEAFEFLLPGQDQKHGVSDPEHILAVASGLIANMPSAADGSNGQAEWQHFANSIHEYFQRIASLNALGERKAHAYEITLSLSDKPSKQRSEKVFEILGLKLHRDKEGLTVKAAEGKSQTKKQDVLAALAIDEQAIEEALAKGKSYALQIPFDMVIVFPSEAYWRNGFVDKEKLPGGIAEAFVLDIRMPRIYSAFSSMDRSSALALASAIPPKMLVDRYPTTLWLYSSALVLNGKTAEVPGGDSARSVWSNLVGADPSTGAAFFEALLRKDDGRLMSFYYALTQLDQAHQRFFTRSGERARRFYELFRNSSEIRRTATGRLAEGGFTQFLREVPLNDDLSVDFPGAPEVWMVAKGVKSSGGSVAKLTRKMKRTAAPDDEDQILIRLATTDYKNGGRVKTELANLVEVARIDAQRSEPLNPESALLLAQGYSTHTGLYSYFPRLGDLETSDYQKLLTLESKCEEVDLATANLRLGELHAFLSLAGALRESGAIKPTQFIDLFRRSLDRFLAARDGNAFTLASLSFVSELMSYAPTAGQSADKAIRILLLGTASPSREKAFDDVLALQKIPSLDTLIAINRALEKPSDNPAVYDEMQRGLESFAVLPPLKAWNVAGDRKKSLEFYGTTPALGIVTKLRLTAAKHKRKEEEDLQKLAAELRYQLEPWVELALVGRIYARYLDGSDLLVSEDPMLVRKHEFVSLDGHTGKLDWFRPANILMSNTGEGSYFVGGLAEFSIAAGQARATGNHFAAEAFATALFASVRATDWRGFNETVQSSFGATVRLAREWIVESASAPDMLAELGNQASGVLSLNRRKSLLDGLERHDWNGVWQSVSVSDLYFLGEALGERAPKPLWRSLQLQAMKQAAQHSIEPDMLGPVAPELSGCAQPRLQRYEPYEEYQRHMVPDILSQRLAELKLNLAWMADNNAWEPERVIRLAEPTADELLRTLKMRDSWDWHAALDAFKKLKVESQ